MVSVVFSANRRDSLKKHKKLPFLAAVLILSLALTQLQAANAGSLSDAKNAKAKAENDLEQTNRQIEALEQQQAALRDEIGQADAELVSLLVNMDILKEELEAKNLQLAQAASDLAEAEQTAQAQYASMKKRIQFMYERGDTAMLDALLASEDMSDFLNRAEYIATIYTYDRNLLEQYKTTVQQAADLKVTVETEKAELEAMQSEYALQQASLEQILADKRAQMGNYDSRLATAKDAAAKFKSAIDAQNKIIKEEERRQKEAAKEAERLRKEQERARKEQEQQQNGQNAANTNVPGTDENSNVNPGFATNISGSAVVSYACQFVGNPYVWGGTSLTNGADCSGFIMSVFANFGISLPHSSAALQNCGKAVSYNNAQPGDLICYPGHVGIYMGNGRIVHAQSTATGITISPAAYRPIMAVRRVL